MRCAIALLLLYTVARDADPGADVMSDGSATVPDATTILTGTGCSQPAPFIWVSNIEDVIAYINVDWCAAGIDGTVTAYLMAPDLTARHSMSADIQTNRARLFIGSIECLQCFVRLDVAGFRYDTPPYDWAGD